MLLPHLQSHYNSGPTLAVLYCARNKYGILYLFSGFGGETPQPQSVMIAQWNSSLSVLPVARV